MTEPTEATLDRQAEVAPTPNLAVVLPRFGGPEALALENRPFPQAAGAAGGRDAEQAAVGVARRRQGQADR